MKIFIDPGHGGPDPGATGNGVTEEFVNLNKVLMVPLIQKDDYDLTKNKVNNLLYFYYYVNIL